jgi:hypothetical protein
MYWNIGCLVRKFDWKSKWRSTNPVQWVEQQGFTALSVPLTEAHPNYFQDPNQMVVFSQKEQEIWLGLGLFHIFNKMCQSNSFTGLGTGAVMVAEDDSGYYGAQEFSDGQARWGAQVTTAPASIWTRQTPSAPKPSEHSDTRRVAIEGISDLLRADPVLIETCLTAQGNDAACGIAWHGEKRGWVLVLPTTGGVQFQEIDRHSFLPSGVQFVATGHPDGWPKYWRQGDLFAAMQEHLSRAWCGVGLSEFSLNYPMLQGPCLLVEFDFDR